MKKASTRFMILECLIASYDVTIEIDGHRLLPDLIDAELPIPLLKEHRPGKIGEVYKLHRCHGHLIASAETDDLTAYRYVSPAVRLLDGRMKLIELSLVEQPKSLHTQIRSRRLVDPEREFRRQRDQHHDLLIAKLQTVQQLVRTIPWNSE